MLDERWLRTLHVEAMRHADLHAEREPHVLFQASTVAALLDGAYDGDLSFAELAQRGDLGLGTLNGLDGEMIALDGCFYRADVGGAIHVVDPAERTPFAVVTRFEPTVEAAIGGPLSHAELLARLDALIPAGATSCAIRLDGRFGLVRARSVPRQAPPYRPLTEVVAEQRVFDLTDVAGTMLGFRFPAYAEGVEIGGYHLHFVDEERRRGGHVLDSRASTSALGWTPRTTSTSSCRPASSWPIRISQRPPTSRSTGSSAALEPLMPLHAYRVIKASEVDGSAQQRR